MKLKSFIFIYCSLFVTMVSAIPPEDLDQASEDTPSCWVADMLTTPAGQAQLHLLSLRVMAVTQPKKDFHFSLLDQLIGRPNRHMLPTSQWGYHWTIMLSDEARQPIFHMHYFQDGLYEKMTTETGRFVLDDKGQPIIKAPLGSLLLVQKVSLNVHPIYSDQILIGEALNKLNQHRMTDMATILRGAQPPQTRLQSVPAYGVDAIYLQFFPDTLPVQLYAVAKGSGMRNWHLYPTKTSVPKPLPVRSVARVLRFDDEGPQQGNSSSQTDTDHIQRSESAPPPLSLGVGALLTPNALGTNRATEDAFFTGRYGVSENFDHENSNSQNLKRPKESDSDSEEGTPEKKVKEEGTPSSKSDSPPQKS